MLAMPLLAEARPSPLRAAATHFLVAAPGSTSAGNPFVFTVTAVDQFSDIATGYSGTVRLTSSDSQAALPSSATLTGGVGFFAAALKTAGSQTIRATDSANSGITGTSAVVTVAALAANHFAVAAAAAAVTGSPVSITVTALDPFNNIIAAYNGTIHFTSSDASATLPANSTLTNGTGVFSVTFKTPGVQSVTATDVSTTTITGTTGNSIDAIGLIVAAFTPTSTGFTAVFSKPFDPTTINLYDTSGALGPDDVLLTSAGGPQTSYHGSLIIDPTDTTITFLRTSTFNSVDFNPSTGVLAAGTYTATFRSAANGFTDASAHCSTAAAITPPPSWSVPRPR